MVNARREANIQKVIKSLEKSAKNKEEQIKQINYSPQMTKLASDSLNRITPLLGAFNLDYLIKNGQKTAESIAIKVRQEAQERPWVLVAKVAVFSFAVGVVLSSMGKRKKRKEAK